MGCPQGDGLSPTLFTIYLEAAQREIRKNLPKRPENDKFLPSETAYADDVDYISTSQDFLEKALKVIEEQAADSQYHQD